MSIILKAFLRKPNPTPTTFSLSAYPNPFNPTTTLTFSLPVAGHIKFDIFDITGSRVGVACPFGGLVPTRVGFGESDLQFYPPGTHSITFDGSGLSSGIYFVRLEAGEYQNTQKLVLLR